MRAENASWPYNAPGRDDPDWHADNGPVGLVSGRANEAAAVADALNACERAGGIGCMLLAIGPFLVGPK